MSENFRGFKITNDGTSNVFYVKDPEARSALPTVEDDDVADNAYKKGDYLILKRGFYEVLKDIAVGDVLTPGTNIELSDMGQELVKLRASVEGVAYVEKTLVASKDYDIGYCFFFHNVLRYTTKEVKKGEQLIEGENFETAAGGLADYIVSLMNSMHASYDPETETLTIW